MSKIKNIQNTCNVFLYFENLNEIDFKFKVNQEIHHFDAKWCSPQVLRPEDNIILMSLTKQTLNDATQQLNAK